MVKNIRHKLFSRYSIVTMLFTVLDLPSLLFTHFSAAQFVTCLDCEHPNLRLLFYGVVLPTVLKPVLNHCWFFYFCRNKISSSSHCKNCSNFFPTILVIRNFFKQLTVPETTSFFKSFTVQCNKCFLTEMVQHLWLYFLSIAK
jgi:hypothetical protein